MNWRELEIGQVWGKRDSGRTIQLTGKIFTFSENWFTGEEIIRERTIKNIQWFGRQKPAKFVKVWRKFIISVELNDLQMCDQPVNYVHTFSFPFIICSYLNPVTLNIVSQL